MSRRLILSYYSINQHATRLFDFMGFIHHLIHFYVYLLQEMTSLSVYI